MPTICSCGCGRTSPDGAEPGDQLCLFSGLLAQESGETAEPDQVAEALPGPATPFSEAG